MRIFFSHAALASSFALLAAVPTQAGAEVVSFIPGTYYLAYNYDFPPVDELDVAVASGTATFTLTGVDNATFSVPNKSVPTGVITLFGSDNPYYQVSAPLTASWSASTYPYLTFWTEDQSGGFTVGTAPGYLGTHLLDLTTSNEGPGQVFTISAVPLPAALPAFGTAILGLIGFGFSSGRTRRA